MFSLATPGALHVVLNHVLGLDEWIECTAALQWGLPIHARFQLTGAYQREATAQHRHTRFECPPLTYRRGWALRLSPVQSPALSAAQCASPVCKRSKACTRAGRRLQHCTALEPLGQAPHEPDFQAACGHGHLPARAKVPGLARHLVPCPSPPPTPCRVRPAALGLGLDACSHGATGAPPARPDAAQTRAAAQRRMRAAAPRHSTSRCQCRRRATRRAQPWTPGGETVQRRRAPLGTPCWHPTRGAALARAAGLAVRHRGIHPLRVRHRRASRAPAARTAVAAQRRHSTAVAARRRRRTAVVAARQRHGIRACPPVRQRRATRAPAARMAVAARRRTARRRPARARHAIHEAAAGAGGTARLRSAGRRPPPRGTDAARSKALTL
eukprot:316285-Chlamydomonas_euryale.AAC.5